MSTDGHRGIALAYTLDAPLRWSVARRFLETARGLSAALRRAGCLAAALLAAGPALAQELDVPTPYLPSTSLNVDEMLRLAQVQPGDVVYDLGSGDGRVVIVAARDYGASGVGIELDAKLVAESTAHARAAGVADRAEFRQADVPTAPVSDATVVTMYLLPPLVRELQDRLYADLAPGSRIIAHDYPFPDWRADGRVVVSKTFYRYEGEVRGARMAGTVRWGYGPRQEAARWRAERVSR